MHVHCIHCRRFVLQAARCSTLLLGTWVPGAGRLLRCVCCMHSRCPRVHEGITGSSEAATCNCISLCLRTATLCIDLCIDLCIAGIVHYVARALAVFTLLNGWLGMCVVRAGSSTASACACAYPRPGQEQELACPEQDVWHTDCCVQIDRVTESALTRLHEAARSRAQQQPPAAAPVGTRCCLLHGTGGDVLLVLFCQRTVVAGAEHGRAGASLAGCLARVPVSHAP